MRTYHIWENKPFTFLQMWKEGSGQVLQALEMVKLESITFNQEVFGNILEEKKRLKIGLKVFKDLRKGSILQD